MSTQIIETATLTDLQFFGEPSTGDGAALTINSTAPSSIVARCSIHGNGAEWGLKLPNNLGSRFSDTTIVGGTERALDIVRGGDHHFYRCSFGSGSDRKDIRTRFSLRKQCSIGIKGGARFITFEKCAINDILLGDYSIYDHGMTLEPVEGIALIDCYNPNGGPIMLRLLNAKMPQLIGTHAVGIKMPAWSVDAYFQWCRKYGDTRAPVIA